jgi:hypothetical protein
MPCVYCGAAEADTLDHIPPKGLFPKPRPSDLITVPCCRPCNKSFEKDDEYFKSHLAIRADIEHHASAMPLTGEVLRSWRRPEGAGLTAFIKDTFATREISGPGEQAFTQHGQVPDNARINRVVDRIARGLLYKETGSQLPAHYRIRSGMWEILDPGRQQEYRGLFSAGSLRSVGGDAFRYAWLQATDDPLATMWLMQFYRGATFVSVTGP